MNQKNFKRNDDDDDWTEIADPDAASKPTSAKKTKGLLTNFDQIFSSLTFLGTLVARPQVSFDRKFLSFLN